MRPACSTPHALLPQIASHYTTPAAIDNPCICIDIGSVTNPHTAGTADAVVARFPTLIIGNAISGAPALGMHNAAVLAELYGVDAARLERLRADGVV